MQTLQDNLSRVLCLIGVHDDEVIEIRFSFGQAGAVETIQCRRCGRVATRTADHDEGGN